MTYRTLMAGAAALLMATLSTPTLAAAVAGDTATSLPANQYVWADQPSSDPVYIVVSIADQRAYVYRDDRLVAASSVSTGKDEKPTPLGSFTILQKEEMHHSNLYDSAPMPFMQRLTWDGVAIHAGRNPGFPASHGCIRVPAAFAKKLYGITGVGTVVTVTDDPIVDPSVMPSFELPDSFDSAGTAAANGGRLTRIAVK